MHNIKLTIEFDGAGFFGWQYQPDRKTVQGELQIALEKLVQKPVKAYGCSRTDASVSAHNYVANFYTQSKLGIERFRRALNYHLPKEIYIKSAELVDLLFHARYNAKSKIYTYRIIRGQSPLRHARAWELREAVDARRINKALKLFVGRKDFQPFCLTRNISGICTLFRLELSETEDEISILIQGDRFLYKMVRRIIGAVVTCGTGRITLADIKAALAGEKHRSYRTAPSSGLILDSVQY
ncbi:tRNA pseudouridine(38-40) synthase TruA [candidate division WOR-3 bacterium JGI_Cruoil_03_51_56]|uniref:tRNA pseudouridine synthase A n=1 Tax=candidate division WOR-3 bacterium JGI_Cruoil_03_51_56 TaxID=1973747 RepID=A0A235BU82_UNCW3|nr:MAG: tRNA pseudouridine(38-40) synthase TruA [candidate division WOR-3 bacterium JGI_Cruoil_03_51_56]